MKRTLKTASILAAPHNLEIKPMDGLKEIDHGHWEQKTRAEVEKEFPEEYVINITKPHTDCKRHRGMLILSLTHQKVGRLDCKC